MDAINPTNAQAVYASAAQKQAYEVEASQEARAMTATFNQEQYERDVKAQRKAWAKDAKATVAALDEAGQ